ncbi:MAG: sporulation transcription factor Spo0A [Clostridia bacterium]|nr:sporulation transcription factor Spo0A [Clostridia bacterium]
MKHSVYVIQEKAESIEEIKKLLVDPLEFVGSSTDGERALKELAEIKPDVLITGLICSSLDGLAVLENLKSSSPATKAVVISSITRDEVIKRAVAFGAVYYMVKPVDAKVLAERIESLAFSDAKKPVSATNLDEKISKIFISVGIPPHIKGYAYLREGVKMAVKSPDVINNITKKLYPGIGEKYSTSASKVERAIRHAIEVAWNRGRIDSINSVFGVRAYVGSEKPTNGEFIALVADKMILEGA